MRSIAPAAPDARFSPFAIFLHWTMAALILGAWILPHAAEFLPRTAEPAIIDLHRAVGETVLLLVFLRAAWRFVSPPPALPGGTTELVRLASHAGHAALYLLMIAVPVFGILMTWATGHDLSVWGLASVSPPAWIDPALRRTFRGIHETAANAILILAGLHAAAALVHHYLFKDGLLDRMRPGRRNVRTRRVPHGRDALV